MSAGYRSLVDQEETEDPGKYILDTLRKHEHKTKCLHRLRTAILDTSATVPMRLGEKVYIRDGAFDLWRVGVVEGFDGATTLVKEDVQHNAQVYKFLYRTEPLLVGTRVKVRCETGPWRYGSVLVAKPLLVGFDTGVFCCSAAAVEDCSGTEYEVLAEGAFEGRGQRLAFIVALGIVAVGVGIVMHSHSIISQAFLQTYRLLVGFLVQKLIYMKAAALIASLLIMIGSIRPLLGIKDDQFEMGYAVTPKAFSMALYTGVEKVRVFSLMVLTAVTIYYGDVVSDVASVRSLFVHHMIQFASLNLGFIVAGAASSAFLVHGELSEAVETGGLKAYYSRAWLAAGLEFFQLLPACLVIYAIFALAAEPDSFNLQAKLTAPTTLLLSSAVVQSMWESMPSTQIQTYAVLHEHLGSISESKLKVSIIISILCLAKAFTGIDVRGTISRQVGQLPTVVGVGSQGSVAMLLVAMYRVFSIASRVVLFPIFQELFYQQLQMRIGSFAIGYGGAMLFMIDLCIQAMIVWRITRNPAKLIWSVASTVSPMDSLLHGGNGGIFTTSPELCVVVHLIEWSVCGFMAFYLKDLDTVVQVCGGRLYFYAREIAILLQWPLLWIIRCRCSYVPGHERTLAAFLKEFVLIKLGEVDRDLADINCPAELLLVPGIVLPPCWPLQVDRLDLTGEDLGDMGAKDLAAALATDGIVKTFILESCGIGDEGFQALLMALRTNDCLESLSLRFNKCGSEASADMAAEMLAVNRTLRVIDFWCTSIDNNLLPNIILDALEKKSTSLYEIVWRFQSQRTRDVLSKNASGRRSIHVLGDMVLADGGDLQFSKVRAGLGSIRNNGHTIQLKAGGDVCCNKSMASGVHTMVVKAEQTSYDYLCVAPAGSFARQGFDSDGYMWTAEGLSGQSGRLEWHSGDDVKLTYDANNSRLKIYVNGEKKAVMDIDVKGAPACFLVATESTGSGAQYTIQEDRNDNDLADDADDEPFYVRGFERGDESDEEYDDDQEISDGEDDGEGKLGA